MTREAELVRSLQKKAGEWRTDSKKYSSDVRMAYLICAKELENTIERILAAYEQAGAPQLGEYYAGVDADEQGAPEPEVK